MNPLVQLHWRQWEDEWLVFERASGRTHQMNSLSAFVAMSLENGESSLDALVDQVSGQFDLADSAQTRIAVLAVVRQFEDLGLVIALEA